MDLTPLAAHLIDAHRDGVPFTWRPSLAPASVDEAYCVQAMVLRAIAGDRRPVAWKVSPPRPGAEPLASPVPAAGLRPSGARIAARGPRVLGVEAEVAFRLASDPDPSSGDIDAHALVLLELCETRFANWEEADALSRLADFQSHGAFAIGSGTRGIERLDFASQPVELQVAAQAVKRASGGHPTGDLAAMLAWAVGHCARRGWPLAKGDVVTMGSWTGIAPLRPGDEVRAAFAGIGEARFTFGD
jgi:2-keto-4-pentenoate hydratase